MMLCRTAFAIVICLFVSVQGEPQCSCYNGCGNNGRTFPGSNGNIVNVAYGKPANMSSTFPNDGASGPACVAVNGRTDTVFTPQTDPNTNCVHTDTIDYDAFWLVDLGRNYTVTDITVYRRQDNFEDKVSALRMSGMSVYVDSQLCYSFLNFTLANMAELRALNKQINITCSTPLTGRHVRFQKHGEERNFNPGAYFITICEVQVWGCRDGLYGADCVDQCGQCAGSDTCSAVTGHCPNGCQPGWQGATCNKTCDAGKYGNDCSSSCGHCNLGDVCHHTNGTCPRGCAAGLDPSDPLCKIICQNGRYGEHCSEQCGHCSGNEQCNPFTGMCVSCQPQFQPPLCTVCTGNRYGASCELNCSTKCGGDGACDRDTGKCVDGCIAGYRPGESGFCNEECEEGKYGKDCSQECGKCTDSCRHDDGFCIGGCIDGYEGPLCAQTSESSPNLAGPVAGAVFGGLCVVALSILAGLLIRRSRKRLSSETASPPQASADQSFESGAPVGLNGQAALPEKGGSAGVAATEESHIYDGLQTPDDSDRDPYSTPVFKGQQDNTKHPHTYQNSALPTSDNGKDYYNI